MTTSVTDARSNFNDQIAHAANVLKRSKNLRIVFEAICRGGKKPKTVRQLMAKTSMKQVALLQLAGKLADQQLVHKTKVGSDTAYGKDRFYAANRRRILGFVKNPEKLKGLPTKTAPKGAAVGSIEISVKGRKVQVITVTCDDFDQFSKVKKVHAGIPPKISEQAFKRGIQKLIGDAGSFTDWGGERNDLYTSKLKYRGQRRPLAFAFKGPGTSGVLTPKKLGKNGDQIQRLFLSPAEIFIVQYHGQIDQSVLEQMHAFATLNSVREDKKIWYGVIDGDDTARLIAAYPKAFSIKA